MATNEDEKQKHQRLTSTFPAVIRITSESGQVGSGILIIPTGYGIATKHLGICPSHPFIDSFIDPLTQKEYLSGSFTTESPPTIVECFIVDKHEYEDILIFKINLFHLPLIVSPIEISQTVEQVLCTVYAIGFAFSEHSHIISDGIISNMNLVGDQNSMLCSCLNNGGLSGGAIADSKGQLKGMVFAIRKDSITKEKDKGKRWRTWKEHYRGEYNNPEEESYRRSIWDKRDEWTIHMNEKNSKLGENAGKYAHGSHSDMTDEEIQNRIPQYRGGSDL